MKERVSIWFLNHPSRLSWIVVEFLRPLPWRRRFANAWWQLRHYGDHEAFRALWHTWERSQEYAAGLTAKPSPDREPE